MTVEGPVSLATGSDPAEPSRRKTRLDGAATTQTALAQLFPMLWLTPREDRLWAGSRSDRMRFFDRLVLAGAPDHGAQASSYEKAQRDRQRLLDKAMEGARIDGDWLSALEAEMASRGVALAAARVDALARLQDEIDARPDNAFPKADLALEGVLEAQLAAGETASGIEDAFIQMLRDARRRDGAAGRSLTALTAQSWPRAIAPRIKPRRIARPASKKRWCLAWRWPRHLRFHECAGLHRC